MTSVPVPLDNLIQYVKSLHPDGGELSNLTDAVAVAGRLDEQADALIGHFVDQARRSGASWSQIGTSMGVSKQAAQQRFVAGDDDLADLIPARAERYGRFTPRARAVLVRARRLLGDGPVSSGALTASLLTEPDGVAARAVHRVGVTDDQLLTALGFAAVPTRGDDDAAAALDELRYTADAKAALAATLKSALRLGHNYIGTEHLLLGVVFAGGPTAKTLAGLGLTDTATESAVTAEIAALRR
jgi:hypothetical protein